MNGSVPPVDSIRMVDQISPVSIRTLATRDSWMVNSFRENQERFRRVTAVWVTSMTLAHCELVLLGSSRAPRPGQVCQPAGA